MKKVLLTMIACAGIGFTHAQVQLNNATNLLAPVGNIGIKTLNPTESLEIGKGSIKLSDYIGSADRALFIDPNGVLKAGNPIGTIVEPLAGPVPVPITEVYWSLYGNDDGAPLPPNSAAGLPKISSFGIREALNIRFFTGNTTSFNITPEANLDVEKVFTAKSSSNFLGTANFSNDIKANRVIIGNPTTVGPNSKLAVEGLISAREVRVLVGNIPDYVFEQDYALMSLNDLEAYIKTNKHLPGIPSASEVEANDGLELGEMNRLLLEKVEELTLHLIAQQKEIEALKLKID